MPEWQAVNFLRHTQLALGRLSSSESCSAVPGEVILRDGLVSGFQTRKAALDAGRLTYPDGFALLRVALSRPLQNRLVWNGKLHGADYSALNGAPLWTLEAEAVNEIARSWLKQSTPGEVDFTIAAVI